MSEDFQFVEKVPEPKTPPMFSPRASRYSYRTKKRWDIDLFQVKCQSDECTHWTGFYVNKRRARLALEVHSC